MVSVTTSQLCHCSAKAAIDNTQMTARSCALLQLYLQKLNFEFCIIFI